MTIAAHSSYKLLCDNDKLWHLQLIVVTSYYVILTRDITGISCSPKLLYDRDALNTWYSL